MSAQLALSDGKKDPVFAGSVCRVETRRFQRGVDESPFLQGSH